MIVMKVEVTLNGIFELDADVERWTENIQIFSLQYRFVLVFGMKRADTH